MGSAWERSIQRSTRIQSLARPSSRPSLRDIRYDVSAWRRRAILMTAGGVNEVDRSGKRFAAAPQRYCGEMLSRTPVPATPPPPPVAGFVTMRIAWFGPAAIATGLSAFASVTTDAAGET